VDVGKPRVEFTQDGVLKAAELKIMNLRPGVRKELVWEEVSASISLLFAKCAALQGHVLPL
jgi:hypothetical protein